MELNTTNDLGGFEGGSWVALSALMRRRVRSLLTQLVNT
jgi:hypothetical protein